MPISMRLPHWLAAAAIALAAHVSGPAQAQAVAPAPTPVVVISDLHLNAGRAGGADWHALEDFRWAKAFAGLLLRVGTEFADGLDLVIAGDFLELWQHPTAACAKIRDSDCGCTLAEMAAIVSDVLKAHEAEFAAIRQFLDSNARFRVVVAPGNHDAALMRDEIWVLVEKAVAHKGGRFLRAAGGTWISADRKVVVEHGHQQAYDVNYFPDWPKVARDCAGTERFYRPWGENFVQTLYNDVELQFPLIDNLLPESSGVKIYMDSRQADGQFANDIARFLTFNLLQTSLSQKLGFLDMSRERTGVDSQKLAFCRKCLGEDLIIRSMARDSPLRQRLETGKPEAGALRLALREQARTMDDDSARAFCERALLINGKLEANQEVAPKEGCSESLGWVAGKIFDPNGTQVLRQRIERLYRSLPDLAFYVYGHTHEARRAVEVRMSDGIRISAVNSGAFQRLMDEEWFKGKTKGMPDAVEALKSLKHDDLAACYPTVVVTYPRQQPSVELKQWYMEENAQKGEFLSDCDSRCSARPGNCPRK